MKKIFLLLVFCSFGIAGFAQIPIAYWSMENAAHSTLSLAPTDQITGTSGTAALNITGAGGISTATSAAGPGITLHAGTAAGLCITSGNTFPNSADPGVGATIYWQFSFTNTAASGPLTLTFDINASGANLHYGVLASTNGGASFTAVSTALLAAAWTSLSLTLPAGTNVIRFYGFKTVGGARVMGLDNVMVASTTTTAGAVFTTANEADIFNMYTSGSTGQYSRNGFTITGAGTNVTINNTSATSGISVSAANTLSVTTGATITFGNTGIVNGAGTFSLASGCTLVTANLAGITAAVGTATGSVQTTTARTFNAGANYTYNGAAAQSTGTGLPTPMLTGSNVTINNAAGVTLTQSTTINSGGTLTLTAGNFTIGANNLVLGPTATVSGAFSNTKKIVAVSTGQVEKQFTASGAYTYPVGDAANYSPTTLTFTAGTFAGGAYAGINLRNVKHPNNASAVNFINRYWNVTLSGITAPTYSIAATYVAGDVAGTEANISAGEYTGALPWIKFGATNVATHTITSSAISSLSDAFTGISTAGPTVTSTANTAVCAGTPVTLSALTSTGDPTLTYSWAPAAGLSATTGSSVTATPTVTTTYTLTITDGNGFTSTATTSLTINPVPAAISGPSILCVGSGATLSDTPLGGTWSSTTGAASINATTGAISGAAAGTTMISYLLAGCAATSIVTVNAPGGPIFGPSVVCTGGSITLTDVIGGGIWTSTAGTGTASVGSTSGIVNGTTAGSVIISYTTAGCNPATTIISVNAYPSPISGASAVCVNATISLSDLSGGGGWTSSDPLTASVGASSGIVLGVAAGTATISYDISGCPVTHVVTVNPLPVAITGPTSVCMTYSITLTDASGSGTWSSSSPLVASVGSSSGIVTGVATGATYITYTFIATGCSSPALLETVYANPTPVFGANSVCMGGTTNLTDPDGGTWSSALPTTASVGSGTGVVTGVAIGSTTITFTALATGCFALQPMTVNPNPSAITGPAVVCAGSTVTLTDAIAGGTWSSNEFWIASIGTDGVVTGITGGGTTTISYVLATTCYTTFTESVNSAPSVIMGDSTLCVGYSTILSDSVSGGTWSSSAPGSIIADPSTGNMLAIATGAVTIFYTITGCNPVWHNITVNVVPATITGADHLCDSVTTNLYDLVTGGVWSSANTVVARIDSTTGVATGVSLGTTNISYTLSTGCYAVLPVTVNPLAPPIAGTDTICSTGSTWLTDIVGGGTWMSSNAAVATIDTFTGLLTGIVPGITYIVYTLPTGCTASLLETAIPPVTPISSPSHVCTGSVINMTDAEPGGTWISSNNYVASVGGTSGVLSGGFPDTVNITYTISAFRGCYTSKTIIVNPLPTPVITYNYASHSVSTYSYYTGYQWYTSTTGLIPGATGPTLVLPHAGDSVYVDVTDTNGCSSRASWYVYNYSGVNNITATTARIYPNPATSTLFIDASVNVRAVISGIDGKKVMEQANAKEVNISTLAAGMYLVALYNDEGQIVMMQKLVKE